MSGLSLRARLTFVVTVVFGVALSCASLVALNVAERELVANTRSAAEGVLFDYLAAESGLSEGAVVNSAEATQFFYLDANDEELSEEDFFQQMFLLEESLILQGNDYLLSEPVDPIFVEPFEIVVTEGFIDEHVAGQVLIYDPEYGTYSDGNGDEVVLDFDPTVDGSSFVVDVGSEALAVAQPLRFPDGSVASVGVSSPLRPVSDSLDTLRRLLIVAVPLLSAFTAIITWLAVTKTLKPVNALTLQAKAITANNIGERLPVPSARDEIHGLAVTMNAMLERLQRSQGLQHQFVSDASHELRSPVAASRVQLEVGAANPNQTDWPATAKAVLVEQERLSSLIDDLLALTRLDERGAGAVGDVDLDDVLSVEASRSRRVVVVISIARPVRITGNLHLLTSAVRNLVDNAARHAVRIVEVRLMVEGDSAVIIVDDDGAGVPFADRQRVFDRFTRLDEARERHVGGAGLGLAITKEVANAHDGDVSVTDAPLGGARFTLHLPLKPS